MKWSHRLVLLLATGFVVGSCLWWFGHAPDFFQHHYGRASEAGSMFGGLSALFTGLGFVGLVYTLILQREQLASAKVESEEARKTGERQRFENTFFQLLQLHTGIVDSLQMERPTWIAMNQDRIRHYRGRDVLVLLESSLRNVLDDTSWSKWQLTSQKIGDRRAFLEEIGEVWYAQHSQTLDHYFRVLYRTLRHIDDSSIDDKSHYGKIVRAQLSRQELLLLFYNALIERGSKMKYEIEKYALIKHLPPSSLAKVSDDEFYSRSARLDVFVRKTLR